MKSKLVFNAVLLVTVAALGMLAYFLPGAINQEDEAPLLSSLRKDDVTRIVLDRLDDTKMVLDKQGAQWRMREPYVIAADGERVEPLLDFLGARSLSRFPVVNSELRKYGLDKPASVLTLNAQRFEFGSQHPLAPNRYVRAADSVHLVTDIINQHLTAAVTSFVDPRLVAPGTRIAAISVPGLTVEQKDGRLTASAGAPSPDTIARFIEEWRGARAIHVRVLTEAERTPSTNESVMVTDDNGATTKFLVIEHTPSLLLARPDIGLMYELPAEAGARLFALNPAPSSP